MTRRDPLADIDMLATLRAGRNPQPEPDTPTIQPAPERGVVSGAPTPPGPKHPRQAPRSTTTQTEQTRRVNLTLDETVYEAVRLLAFQQRSTVPDVIRTAITKHLDS